MYRYQKNVPVFLPNIPTHFHTRAQDPQFNLLYKFMTYTKLGKEYLTGIYTDGITLFAPNNAGACEWGSRARS